MLLWVAHSFIKVKFVMLVKVGADELELWLEEGFCDELKKPGYVTLMRNFVSDPPPLPSTRFQCEGKLCATQRMWTSNRNEILINPKRNEFLRKGLERLFEEGRLDKEHPKSFEVFKKYERIKEAKVEKFKVHFSLLALITTSHFSHRALKP